MDRQWTIGHRIYGLAGFLMLVIVCVGIFALVRANLLKTISASITDDSMPGLSASADIKADLAQAHIQELSLLRAQTAGEKKSILDEIARLSSLVKEAIGKYDGTIFASEDRQLFNALKDRREAYLRIREQFFQMAETNVAEAEKMADGVLSTAYKEYDSAGYDLMNYNKKMGAQRAAMLAESASRTRFFLLIAVAVSLVFGIAGSVILVGRINKILCFVVGTVASGTEQITSAAGQVSSASQSLAEGASEQASSLEETSSSLEEMSSMTKRNAEGARQAKDLANDTKAAAEAGSKCVQAMNQSMDRIQVSSDEMRRAMDAVKESNNEVAKIIKTIDEIAFQTNILALNAAVEAARAGEAGMGFSVVAEEVRNLAQKSAAAARETAAKIESAIGRTEDGVRVSEKVVGDLKVVLDQSKQVESSLKGIEQKSREVDGVVAEIAAASLEQSQGIEQVNAAVSQVDKVTQSNAANAEESASSANELNAQAVSMSEAVRELQALVGGKSAVAGDSARSGQPKIQADPGRRAPKSKQDNGHHAPTSSPRAFTMSEAKGANSRMLPMNDDFKDF